MAKEELSESETSGNSNSNSSSSSGSGSEEEPQTLEKAATDYEKQRQARIAENKARIEFLGLRNIANSLLGSSAESSGSKNRSRKAKSKSKSKKVVKEEEEDDDYRPNDDEDKDEDDDDGIKSEDFEEESVFCRKSRVRSKKVKNRAPLSSKKSSVKKDMDNPEFMDEYEDLLQAIALSLKDAGEKPDQRHRGSSQGSASQALGVNEKDHAHVQDDNTRRKKRKPFTSRVQMTEDDLAIQFCQFDEVGKGNITLRDVRRMAATHDFTWTDKELADMIRCFDSDHDGKLTMDDFRNIVQRCNILKAPEDP